jgi:ankyrin repeat protein
MQNNMTPLHIACWIGFGTIFLLLLQAGADKEAKDDVRA